MESIMGFRKMIEELKRLNPGVSFYYDETYNVIYISSLNLELMKFPPGYYYSEKNGITNKHRTESGIYESFDVMLDFTA